MFAAADVSLAKLCRLVLPAGPLNVRTGHGARAEHAVLHCLVQEKADSKAEPVGFPGSGGGPKMAQLLTGSGHFAGVECFPGGGYNDIQPQDDSVCFYVLGSWTD